MSFILDALKKSESDRQRQNGPALFEVKVAPRRTGLPLWGIAIALLLGVNLIIVMWMLLRHPSARTEAAIAAATPAPAVAVAASAVPAPQPQAVPVASSPVVSASAPVPAAGAAVMAPATTLPAPSAGAGVPINAPATEEQNPEDFAPASEPAPMLGSHVRRGTADGVPLYQDVATPGTRMPSLRLDLHVFAARPQDRFVMINMKKLREGDSLPEGVHVETITPDGAILSYAGSRFMLPKD